MQVARGLEIFAFSEEQNFGLLIVVRHSQNQQKSKYYTYFQFQSNSNVLRCSSLLASSLTRSGSVHFSFT